LPVESPTVSSPSPHSLRVHSGEKQCVKCGSKTNLTKHHYDNTGKGPWDWMCRTPCHDVEHEMLPRNMQNPEEHERKKAERRARRAQRRVQRDMQILHETHTTNWMHIADQWTLEEKRVMLRYLEECLLRERGGKAL
jgi:hypothetical protein